MPPSPSLVTSASFVFPTTTTHDEQQQQLKTRNNTDNNNLNRPHLVQSSPVTIRTPPPIQKVIPTVPTIIPGADYFVEPKNCFHHGHVHSRSSSGASSNISLSKSHKPANNSISSMASTTSDLTIYENVVFHGQPVAPGLTNDEFVQDSSGVKNVLNLLLSLDGGNSSVSGGTPTTGTANSGPSRSTPLPKASSATESRFNLNKLGRFHTGGDYSCNGNEMTPSTSLSNTSSSSSSSSSLPSSTTTAKAALLKKQATLPINFPQAETPTTKNFGDLHLTIPLAGPSGSFFKSPVSMKGWSPSTSSIGASPITPLDESSIINLSPGQIKYCNLDQFQSLIEGESIYPSTSQLGKVLMIDIRPFSDFIHLHIFGSINICLPSTLLRRNNFDLNRCINSLPTMEKSMLQSYLAFKADSIKNNHTFSFPYSTNGLPPIILMDTHGALPNLLFFIKKWINNDLWDSSAQIFILSEDIKNLPDNLVESGKLSLLNTSSPISSIGAASFSMSTPVSTTCLTPSQLVGGAGPGGGPDSLGSPATRYISEENSLVSQFTLPSPRRVFKLRHNEELLATSMAVSDNPFETNYATALISNAKDNQSLPKWLRASLEGSNSISNDFHRLERLEQDRLNTAFTGYSEGYESDVPKISSGIEFGHKNRYKDIFLYEHSRVKLNDRREISDYINASYIDATTKVVTDLLPHRNKRTEDDEAGSHLKYIATQGPLNETAGDFWRCVLNEKCRLIISLTDETENGVSKCCPFWKSGAYETNGSIISVKIMDQERYHDSLLLRSFEVKRGNEVLYVLQAHLTSWPDMLTCELNEDIIKLITLKHYLVDICKPETLDYPVIVHCSAGCGRTGTLCAIDTVVNLISQRGDADFEYDPIFEIVNCFRKQRVSMVQTLRQYSLVYDVLWAYVKEGLVPKSEWLDLAALHTVQAFVDTVTLN
ncbi:uncharacterized protein KQ657_003283 [Scheffersomyces spartinae]|uniref:protein-tyrosine-phosphatase n=1 Tax=Scheffersomyces spartinae TaxID=45513 RepID=A0A9P7VCG3_9ASCO|nr:uncharacterized protein KQ657_003283 [Scheffersomyces spartinae]KAG7195520.1 hypothetical protein KQ657_003283 [Scheffersomyces spartinae]